MTVKRPAKKPSQLIKKASAPKRAVIRAPQKPNVTRRHRTSPTCDEAWTNFIDNLEDEIASLDRLPDNVRKTPFYSLPNVVKRAVYRFAAEAKKRFKPAILEATIDRVRIAAAGPNKTLRTLRKNIRQEIYFWVLTGLHLDCPTAKVHKGDVTRFAQQLKYARRHKVPEEFLVGFLLQSGSLAEIYRRSRDVDYREAWYIAKKNTGVPSPAEQAAG